MKNRLDFNFALNALIVIALVALVVQWISAGKKPRSFDTLIQSEEGYWWQVTQNKLDAFKRSVEDVQPQHRKIGKVYYAHMVAVSKTLDSSRVLVQEAISMRSSKKEVSARIASMEKMCDSLFNQFAVLRSEFSPDSLKKTTAKEDLDYLENQIKEYNEETEKGKYWISRFKTEIKKQDWAQTLPELRALSLYDLEGQYADFITAEYSILISRDFDHYVYMAQGLIEGNPKMRRGSLAFNAPKEMELYSKDRVKVLISKHYQQELLAKSKGEGVIDSVTVSDIMTVKLIGEDFQIVPLDDEEQGVTDDGYTQWEFEVTPMKSGSLDLYVKAGIVYSAGKLGVTRKSFPVYERKIDVRVNPMERLAYFVTDRWEFIISTFLIPALSWGYSRVRRRFKSKD